MGAIFSLYEASRGKHAIRTCGCNCGHGHTGHAAAHKQAMPAARGKGKEGEEEELLVLVFKKVVTMNPTWPTAKVVAMHAGRIVGVGDSVEEMAPWLRRAREQSVPVRVDRQFERDFCFPGFVEPHAHPLIGGIALSLPCVAYHDTPSPLGEDIEGCKTKADVLERLREEHRKAKAGVDLLAWGWDPVAMGGHLSRTDLDAIASTDRAICVWDSSMHNGYANSAALRKCHINLAKAASVPGIVFREDGSLDGAFLGIEALYFLMPVMKQAFHPKKLVAGMQYLTELARQNGITTMAEMFLGVFALPLELRLFETFFNDPHTPCRCVAVVAADKACASWGGALPLHREGGREREGAAAPQHRKTHLQQWSKVLHR